METLFSLVPPPSSGNLQEIFKHVATRMPSWRWRLEIADRAFVHSDLNIVYALAVSRSRLLDFGFYAQTPFRVPVGTSVYRNAAEISANYGPFIGRHGFVVPSLREDIPWIRYDFIDEEFQVSEDDFKAKLDILLPDVLGDIEHKPAFERVCDLSIIAQINETIACTDPIAQAAWGREVSRRLRERQETRDKFVSCQGDLSFDLSD